MTGNPLGRPRGDGSLFPNGPWRGYYLYPQSRRRHRMDLRLEFAGGLLNGEGIDDIGTFMIRGRYDDDSMEVNWTKAYHHAHEVFYRGFREGRGIWGTWTIPNTWTGGFQIWPGGSGDEEVIEAAETIQLPAPAAVRGPGGRDPA